MVACGRAMKPRPDTTIPMRHTVRGLKRSSSQPCAGLRMPANSCEPENALDIANLLHPNWCSDAQKVLAKGEHERRAGQGMEEHLQSPRSTSHRTLCAALGVCSWSSIRHRRRGVREAIVARRVGMSAWRLKSEAREGGALLTERYLPNQGSYFCTVSMKRRVPGSHMTRQCVPSRTNSSTRGTRRSEP